MEDGKGSERGDEGEKEREIEEEREKSKRATLESASDVIDKLGLGEEWPRDKKPERGEALPESMQEEKKGKRVRAVKTPSLGDVFLFVCLIKWEATLEPPSFVLPLSQVIPGRLLAGGAAKADVDFLVETAGVRTFVSLQGHAEWPEASYERRLEAWNDATNEREQIQLIRLPIEDYSIAPDDEIVDLVERLRDLILSSTQDQSVIYLHCKGGHGRTGVVMTLLVSQLFPLFFQPSTLEDSSEDDGSLFTEEDLLPFTKNTLAPALSSAAAVRVAQQIHDCRESCRGRKQKRIPETEPQRAQVRRLVPVLAARHQTDLQKGNSATHQMKEIVSGETQDDNKVLESLLSQFVAVGKKRDFEALPPEAYLHELR
uniref:Tyrosine specific protein phosphatases domain-containing protein n=1 Tax=Chromera velia CCMP2878 TaxID=1169474 RepID=A0A0G4GAV1_9ALVE|eukprot:Cvel_21073.t1-p1 / transcript=Cvel_21073.t1 / gene=Cvel_21073 / organism=Chromera_velia_CCMP2878 / gene_product=hypothetical protein / transcript_product=hypothetical protein / location=Cvel_scaffold1948:3776-8829(-) / protein_length=371 / sequence_SO=supercontig / SO=protein_coding / is_pseudo=false